MDLKASLKKLADFLERPLNADDIDGLMQHLNVKSFQKNASVNNEHMVNAQLMKSANQFVRRGQIGGNPELTPEIAEKIDEWIERSLMDSDMKFPHAMQHKMEMYKMRASSQFKN